MRGRQTQQGLTLVVSSTASWRVRSISAVASVGNRTAVMTTICERLCQALAHYFEVLATGFLNIFSPFYIYI